MSNDLNQCQFIGRLGKDPEVRYAPDGAAVANFSLACGWKTSNKEGTEWVRVTAFGKLAEICGEYLKKGKQVFIQGRMQTREYEKDGSKRYVTEIIADQMQMLGSKDSQ
ncbi:Single-stranded DNA-binding protein [compost metagenome]